MKRFALVLLSLVSFGLVGCGNNRHFDEIPSFGESKFEQLDRNHDGTVVESELLEAATAPEFNESERELIKSIHENIAGIGHITASEEFTHEASDGGTFVKVHHSHGIDQFEFKELGENQQIRRTNMKVLLLVYIVICLTISTGMCFGERMQKERQGAS